MPDTPQRLRVFLCHASGDKPRVRELYQRLLAEGWIDPWLDARKLLPGQDWRTAIEEAVETADNVILCLSNASINKEGFVQKEMRYAREIALEKTEETIFLIPLRLDNCEVPRGLRFLQWVDFFGEQQEQGYRDLLESLKIRSEQKLHLAAAAEAEGKRLQAEEQLRLEAEARSRQELIEKIEKEAHEKVCLEMEARLRLEAEARARQEYEARKQAPRTELQKPDLVLLSKKESAVAAVPGLQTWAGIEFVRIPAGKFLMGSVKDNKQACDDEKPQHEVDLPYDYWLARFPLMNAQYDEFIRSTGGKHPVADWQLTPDHPVVNVSWKEAMKYCRWLDDLLNGKLPSGYVLHLPSEAEWEKAARGADGRLWPWGNTFDRDKCNLEESGKRGTTPVGLYSPQGDSPYGCADLAGNIWEWTHSLNKPYPYQANDGREYEKSSGDRILRGGGFDYVSGFARCACRYGYSPVGRYGNIGFRCVVSREFLS